MKKSSIPRQPGTTKKTPAPVDKGKNDSAVKEALKKEKQPSTEEDLSPLHNNKSIGTTGGDQRASENEQDQSY
ncbi:MAG: hypothetical protein JWP81_2635 [Ferruginibacter sp.]|nr:hypothetical protein [Ferruginibacter sp.]